MFLLLPTLSQILWFLYCLSSLIRMFCAHVYHLKQGLLHLLTAALVKFQLSDSASESNPVPIVANLQMNSVYHSANIWKSQCQRNITLSLSISQKYSIEVIILVWDWFQFHNSHFIKSENSFILTYFCSMIYVLLLFLVIRKLIFLYIFFWELHKVIGTSTYYFNCNMIWV